MVEWLALRAGSRLLLMPKAEAMKLAPKQSAVSDDPDRSVGFLFVTEIALVKLRSGGVGLRHFVDPRAPLALALPIVSWFGIECELREIGHDNRSDWGWASQRQFVLAEVRHQDAVQA